MKHVLLPIDGSTRSLRTIDMVQQTYRPQDTEVTLLMVLPDQMHIDGQFARDRMARKAAQELETFAALLPGWTVRTELLWGSPGPEIVYYARERGFDALVMTRSSRGPLQKLRGHLCGTQCPVPGPDYYAGGRALTGCGAKKTDQQGTFFPVSRLTL